MWKYIKQLNGTEIGIAKWISHQISKGRWECTSLFLQWIVKIPVAVFYTNFIVVFGVLRSSWLVSSIIKWNVVTCIIAEKRRVLILKWWAECYCNSNLCMVRQNLKERTCIIRGLNIPSLTLVCTRENKYTYCIAKLHIWYSNKQAEEYEQPDPIWKTSDITNCLSDKISDEKDACCTIDNGFIPRTTMDNILFLNLQGSISSPSLRKPPPVH